MKNNYAENMKKIVPPKLAQWTRVESQYKIFWQNLVATFCPLFTWIKGTKCGDQVLSINFVLWFYSRMKFLAWLRLRTHKPQMLSHFDPYYFSYKWCVKVLIKSCPVESLLKLEWLFQYPLHWRLGWRRITNATTTR